ncbi:MAG: hypothetical protein LIO76_03390 [Clostridiales bacterium]|nr:hypothetical protein [Clostridiales bacterium]
MNKEKTNRLTRLWSVLLLIFSMAAAMSVPAAASDSSSSEDQTDKIFLIVGEDSEDEVVSAKGGFIVEDTDGSVFIITDLSIATEDVDHYALYDLEEMIGYEHLEVTGQLTDYGLLTLELPDNASLSSRYVTLDYPEQYSELHIVSFNSDLEASSAQFILMNASLETIGNTEILTLEGVTDSDSSVGCELLGLIDDDGNLIGVTSSAGISFSLMSDAEEFHSEIGIANDEEAETAADTSNDEPETEAAVPQDIALLVGTDADGEIVAHSSAVVLEGKDNSLVVMADSSVYTSEATSYQVYTDTGSVEVTYTGVRGDSGIVLFSAENWSGDPDEDYLVYTATQARIGESATLLYYDGDMEVNALEITISGYSVLLDGLHGLECENADSINEMLLESGSLLPAAIVNANGDCIGVWMPESVDGIYINAFVKAS